MFKFYSTFSTSFLIKEFIIYFIILCSFCVNCDTNKEETSGKTFHKKHPNIIMIIADDLGWMDVGYHGSNEIQTPNIDALAYHGMSLHRHYGLPTCSPSRSALLTGKHAIHTGMQYPLAAGNPVGIPLNESLLPQYLKTLGYETHLVGKWHLGYHTKKHLPTSRGFDTHFGYYSGYISYFDGIHISQNVAGLDVRRNEKPVWHELSGKYATRVFTNEAIHIINDHHDERPLFLEVAHLAPHSGNTGARLQINDIDKNEQQFGYIKNESRKLYAGMVKELDDSVGQIIFALNETDLLKDSIVIFLSDNGAPSYEPIWHTTNFGSNYPLRGEKASLHEGGIRTVGAIWSPLFKQPSTVYKQLFHLVDWLPTLFTAAGGDSSELKHLDGISHWDELVNNNNSQINERNLLLNIYNGNEAITNGKWKLIKSNKNSSFLFSNNYYGSKGKGDGIPEYNITKILLSPTGTILQSTINFSENSIKVNNSEQKFLKLREKNTIICQDFENTTEDDCGDYCLFNLLNDPCEKNNLVLKEQKIYHELKNVLDKYRNEIIEPEENIFDINSSPEYWNNYWNPWLTDSGTHIRENTHILISFSLVIIYNYYRTTIFQ